MPGITSLYVLIHLHIPLYFFIIFYTPPYYLFPFLFLHSPKEYIPNYKEFMRLFHIPFESHNYLHSPSYFTIIFDSTPRTLSSIILLPHTS